MEAFKIKNGLSAKRYLGSTTTLSGSTIDLSLGSMFSTTLSSDPAYTFTNPPASGNAQAFSVEVTGGTTNFVNDSFATNLYNGTASSQTITNGLDLATDGGLVWIKWRSGALGSAPHVLVDTVRGVNKNLRANTTDAELSHSSVDSFTSTGFTLSQNAGPQGGTNYSGTSQVAWTFKKQAKFFDVVTYTGNFTAGKTVSHNLGSVPGMIIIKDTSNTRNWIVYHRSIGEGKFLKLNATDAEASNTYNFNNTAPSSTQFTLGESTNTNTNGASYVAYLFAHDTASDSRIKCGSFTPNGSGEASIDLGWEAQFVIWKRTDALQNWYMVDSQRDIGVLRPNTSDAEVTNFDFWNPTATGFDVLNLTASSPYIYMAIRGDGATDSAITWPSSVKWPSGVAPTTPAPGTKDLFTFLTTDGGTTYYGKKAAEGLA